ncbi:MAG: type I-B CRISPR-associated protein Cas5b [Cytophagales bacterium]|nr:type I-B CRISPR-associated protein Cas5b [Cytophagales bacterium]
MNSKSFIIFDVFAEFGHFRKFNTTTSPLSYSIPTPTAIAGLIGAVLGIEREDNKNKVKQGNTPLRWVFSPKNTKIGIRVLNKVNKVNIGFNLLDTDSPQSFFNIISRTQIEYELLKNPVYRIYLDWKHPRRSELIDRLTNKQFHFNPYLGLSQFTADMTWVGEKQGKKIESHNYVPIHSAINLSQLSDKETPVDFELMKKQQIQVETLPIEMKSNRVITRYGEVLVETTGNPILSKVSNEAYAIEGEGNIQLL